VRKHALRGIFFKDSHGSTCIWGPDIDSMTLKSLGWRGVKRKQAWGQGSRSFLILQQPSTLKVIDKPLPERIAALFRHTSERGWNLPVEHPRHFMKLPLEIRRAVLAFAVVLQGDGYVGPQTVSSNWKTGFCMQGCDVVDYPWNISRTGRATSKQYSSLVSSVLTFPADGRDPYYQLRRYKKPSIDATLLRTCKFFYDVGNELLYRRNRFTFGMLNTKSPHCPPMLIAAHEIIRPDPILADNLQMYRPDPIKPAPDDDECLVLAISEIQRQVPLRKLQGWVYYDPFLRFLHTVGTNAKLLKSLQFTGALVKRDACEEDKHKVSRHCSDDLLYSMKLYLPIIRQICTGLEELTMFVRYFLSSCFRGCCVLIVLPQVSYDQTSPGTSSRVIRNYRLLVEDALAKFITTEIPKIISLKSLKVYHQKESSQGKLEDYVAEFARPTMELIETRERKEVMIDQNITQLAQNVKLENLHCGFCGETNHIWPECYNLCSFCGGFGHFIKTCPVNG
jgi:hypothetical protein